MGIFGQVPMVPILMRAKNQSHPMHKSRDIREMDGSDDVYFLENRVLGLAEFFWEGSYGPNTSAHQKSEPSDARIPRYQRNGWK
jgi:hypothetical protein